VEGEPNPESTDTIMRLADSALVMVYRNHAGPSILDSSGVDTIKSRFMGYMLKKQCTRCLDDKYAKANYIAKMKLMVEADCQCTDNCRKTSFCAFDTSSKGWGDQYSSATEYMTATLRDTLQQIHADLKPEQYQRLFGKAYLQNNQDLSLFVVHNWEWFTCYFETKSMTSRDIFGIAALEQCSDYRQHAKTCRASK
jgi:hypothetical protein